MCGGKIARNSSDDAFSISNIRWCSMFRSVNIFGTLPGSKNRKDERHTDTFSKLYFSMAFRMFIMPTDITVVGFRSFLVPSTTQTSSWSVTKVFCCVLVLFYISTEHYSSIGKKKRRCV